MVRYGKWLNHKLSRLFFAAGQLPSVVMVAMVAMFRRAQEKMSQPKIWVVMVVMVAMFQPNA